MLRKAHLTLHSRMPGSRWVIVPSWLSESLRSFLYSSSLYSCHLFLISSASVRSVPLLSFIVPIFAWNVPLVSLIFLKRSLVFPILFFPSISLYWQHRKAFLSPFAILWNSAFKWIYLSFSPLPFAYLLFSDIFKASSDNHFAFLQFFFLGMVFITTSCTIYEPLSIVLLALYLSDLIPWIYLSLPLYNHKRFDLDKSEFCNRDFMIWATVTSRSCFCWLYRISPSLAEKNIINLVLVLAIWWGTCVESSLVLLEEGVCYDQCVLLAKLC